MILIIGSAEDMHCAYMYNELQKREIEACYFDSRNFPGSIFMGYSPNDGSGLLQIGRHNIPLREIQGVYWRWFYGIKSPNSKNNTRLVTDLVYRERKSFLESFLLSFNGCNWVNSFEAIRLHKTKIHQLQIMSQNGIRIPHTIVTNDIYAVRDFFIVNRGNIICKPVLGGAYTRRFTEKDFQGDAFEKIKNAPVQFQELLEGADIRAFAMGNEVYAARIEANTLDSREDKNQVITPVELPDSVKEDCLKILKLLKLQYSGIDIKYTKEGEYVFLEANPAPMFIQFEQQTGYPITEALIQLLCA